MVEQFRAMPDVKNRISKLLELIHRSQNQFAIHFAATDLSQALIDNLNSFEAQQREDLRLSLLKLLATRGEQIWNKYDAVRRCLLMMLAPWSAHRSWNAIVGCKNCVGLMRSTLILRRPLWETSCRFSRCVSSLHQDKSLPPAFPRPLCHWN